MAKQEIDTRAQLIAHKFEFGLLQKIPCSKQENKAYAKLLKNSGSLPEGVYPFEYENGYTSGTEFYTVSESDLSEAEIQEYLKYKQLSLIRTIKNCALFFTILTIIGMMACFYIMMNA